ncbi:hypothetical protein BDW02DRAFT_371823 [Decorospora gaudefroyi]|uniref:Uncharacterized protein n=1 Tax=Decorospora gaudefroyi TaxID=184978 RepID=A0A6A5K8M1_9PLEO|nr:hypothetical protein BDW02DRAFT_371823 [Decorospora gaudefroyi]
MTQSHGSLHLTTCTVSFFARCTCGRRFCLPRPLCRVHRGPSIRVCLDATSWVGSLGNCRRRSLLLQHKRVPRCQPMGSN